VAGTAQLCGSQLLPPDPRVSLSRPFSSQLRSPNVPQELPAYVVCERVGHNIWESSPRVESEVVLRDTAASVRACKTSWPNHKTLSIWPTLVPPQLERHVSRLRCKSRCVTKSNAWTSSACRIDYVASVTMRATTTAVVANSVGEVELAEPLRTRLCFSRKSRCKSVVRQHQYGPRTAEHDRDDDLAFRELKKSLFFPSLFYATNLRNECDDQ